MLPIGVVVPTRNSMSLLPRHLEAMAPWLDQVQEVVVVDSQSRDGSWERLQSDLRHPRLTFFQQPPGLYQSWNFAIGQLTAPYCYVSTVGETITREGLEHLAGLLDRFQADVAVSKPAFVDEQGRPMTPPRWPVDDFIETLRLREPALLSGPALFLFTLLNYRDAILGSSASNLYRTATLQARPFPTGFGTAGDGGWGLQHCLDIRLAVTPEVFSTFVEHPKSYSKAEYHVDDVSAKKLRTILEAYRDALPRQPGLAEAARELQVEATIALLEEQARHQLRLEACRNSAWPWSLNPAAWIARSRRSACIRQLDALKARALQTRCSAGFQEGRAVSPKRPMKA